MVSEDHSLVWEMVQEGRLTPEEARTHPQSNIITQSLGDEQHPPSPEASTQLLEKGSRLLLCSDGLNGMLPDSHIRAILAEAEPANITATCLVEAANHAGGEDNITVIVIESSQEDGETEAHKASLASPPASPLEETTQGMKTQPIMEEARPPLSHPAQTEGSPDKGKKGPSLVHLAGIVAVFLLLLFIWWLLIG